MSTNPFAPAFDQLPENLAIFPLMGVLLLPGGRLPLNVFEPRYLKMVEDAFAGNRLIGLIQPRGGEANKPALYDIGCAGKITQFEETPDGRYLITVTGVCRFKIAQELASVTPYRQIKADWNDFKKDIETEKSLKIERVKLLELLKTYFATQDMTCDWEAIDGAPDARLITCLSMVCPFEPQEKQALLEAPNGQARAEMFMAMLEMAVKGDCAGKSCGGY